MDDDRDIDEVIAERRAASDRATPDRIPVGAHRIRPLMLMTVGAAVAATVILVLAFVLA